MTSQPAKNSRPDQANAWHAKKTKNKEEHNEAVIQKAKQKKKSGIKMNPAETMIQVVYVNSKGPSKHLS